MRYSNEILHHDGKRYVQVNSAKARNIFSNGGNIVVQSCGIPFDNEFFSPCLLQSFDGESFDTFVNAFVNYRCGGVFGRYPHFFAEIS